MKNCKDKNSEKYKSLKEKRDLQHDLADQVRNEEIFSITYIVKAPVVKDTSSMTNKEMLECLGFVSSESETRDYDSKRVAQSSALIVTQWFGTEWFSRITSYNVCYTKLLRMEVSQPPMIMMHLEMFLQ